MISGRGPCCPPPPPPHSSRKTQKELSKLLRHGFAAQNSRHEGKVRDTFLAVYKRAPPIGRFLQGSDSLAALGLGEDD
eukprot:1148985-Pelagomonas_calceolata.AAC.4